MLLFDVFIIIAAIRVWVHIKQTLPPADRTVRVTSPAVGVDVPGSGADATRSTPRTTGATDDCTSGTTKTSLPSRIPGTCCTASSFLRSRMKRDAVPGRIYTGWFKPTRVPVTTTSLRGILRHRARRDGRRARQSRPQSSARAAWLASHVGHRWGHTDAAIHRRHFFGLHLGRGRAAVTRATWPAITAARPRQGAPRRELAKYSGPRLQDHRLPVCSRACCSRCSAFMAYVFTPGWPSRPGHCRAGPVRPVNYSMLITNHGFAVGLGRDARADPRLQQLHHSADDRRDDMVFPA